MNGKGRWKRILAGVILFAIGVFCFLYPDFREWRTRCEVARIEAGLAGEQMEETDGCAPFDGQSEGAFGESDFTPANGASEQKSGERSGEGARRASANEGEKRLLELYREMQAYNARLAESGQQITDAWNYEQPEIDVSALPDGEQAVGYIEISDMDVRLPLYIGASKEHLALGAAVLAGTSMPVGGTDTNCVIAAHRGYRGSAYFQPIENLTIGSCIFLKTLWGTLAYRAFEIRIVNPDDIGAIQIREGRDMVTLLTCHPYMSGGKYRYLVFCERVDEENYTENTKEKQTGPERSAESEPSGDATEKREKEETRGKGSGLIVWEKHLRVLFPVLTFLIAFFVVVRRYNRNGKTDRSH